MTPRIRFDEQDKLALATLDPDFVIDDSGEIGTISGAMEIVVVRAADDRFKLTIGFPGGEEFSIWLSRMQTMKQLGVDDAQNRA